MVLSRVPVLLMMPLVYSAADVFVSPADDFQESLGLTLLAAQVSGIPIIASDFGNYCELIMPSSTLFGHARPTLLAAAWAAMSGGDPESPPLFLRFRGRMAYTVAAHCSAVVTASSSKVVWAA